MRKVGHMTTADISDTELRELFGSLDTDDSGDVGLDELTAFLWGTFKLEEREEPQPVARAARSPKARSPRRKAQKAAAAAAAQKAALAREPVEEGRVSAWRQGERKLVESHDEYDGQLLQQQATRWQAEAETEAAAAAAAAAANASGATAAAQDGQRTELVDDLVSNFAKAHGSTIAWANHYDGLQASEPEPERKWERARLRHRSDSSDDSVDGNVARPSMDIGKWLAEIGADPEVEDALMAAEIDTLGELAVVVSSVDDLTKYLPAGEVLRLGWLEVCRIKRSLLDGGGGSSSGDGGGGGGSSSDEAAVPSPSEAVPPATQRGAPTRLAIVARSPRSANSPRKIARAPRRRVEGSSQQQQQQQQRQPSEQLNPRSLAIKVVCPATARAGETLLVTTPDGQHQLEVVVPDEVAPGESFHAAVPADLTAAQRSPERQQARESKTQQHQSPRGGPMAVAGASSPGGGSSTRLQRRQLEQEAEAVKAASNGAAAAGVSTEMATMRKKLSSLSYGVGGEDPVRLFRHFDRDNSGTLDFGEFRSAVRKGAHVTVAMISDGELRKLFYAVDADDGGDVSLEELTDFIWGPSSAERIMGMQQQQQQADMGSSGDREKQRRRRQQKKLGFASPDAGFLKTTPSFERKLQAKASKQSTRGPGSGGNSKAVDGMPRFNLAALHVSADETPGVGSYDLIRADRGSIEARAQAAKKVGRRRATSKPISPRTSTIHPPSENDHALRELRSGRSHWVGSTAGEGAGGPVGLGHTEGLAGKKHIVTGRCTFNA